MQREQQSDMTELKDEALDAVNGGAFRFIRAIFHSGVVEGEDRLGRNSQAWVTSAT